jgi:tetratricopeptide (TPR) repeat protein
MTTRHTPGPGPSPAFVLAFALLVALPSLAIGAAPPPLQAATSFTALALFSALAAGLATRRERVVSDPLTLVVLAAAAFTLLQAAPIGAVISDLLGGASRARIAVATAGLATPFSSISVEPATSVLDAFKLLAFGAVLAGVSTLSRRADRASLFLHAVAVAGLAQAALGLVNLLAGPTHMFGLYASPLTERSGFHGTLLNDNHAAALMNLSTFAWLALALDAESGRFRPVYLVAMVGTAAGSIATMSRAGGGILLLFLAAFAAWRRLSSTGGSRATPVMRALLLASLLVASLVVLAVFEDLVNLFADTTLLPRGWGAKTALWEGALDLVADHPWAGVGRGGVVSAATAYIDAMPDNAIEYFENLPLQALADWGIPFGLLALLGGALAAGRLLLAVADQPAGMAAGFGVAAVAVHNLFDFNIEVPGVALPVACVLGVLAGRGATSGPARPSRPAARVTLVAGSLMCLAAGAFALPWALGHSRTADAAALTALVGRAQSGENVDAGVATELESALRFHPHDAQVLTLAARIEGASGRLDRAADLAARALALAPESWDAGLILADARVRQGQPEAAVAPLARLLADHPLRRRELYAALDRPSVPRSVAAAVLAVDPVARAEYLNMLVAGGRSARAEAFLRASLKLAPDDHDLLVRLALLYLNQEKLDASSDVATRLLALHPDREGGWLVLGRVYRARHELLEALAMVTEAAKLAADPTEAWFDELGLLSALRRWEEFDALARVVSRRVATDRYWTTRLLRLQSDRELASGDLDAAVRDLDRAALQRPTDPEIPLRKARVLRQYRRFQEALVAYRRVLQLSPTHAEALREVEEIGKAQGELDRIR